MAVPDEARAAIARWCATRVPDAERGRWRLTWTVQGDVVTLVQRHAPALAGERWPSTPLARLRHDPGGHWTLHRPGPGGTWRPTTTGPDPVALLDAQAPA